MSNKRKQKQKSSRESQACILLAKHGVVVLYKLLSKASKLYALANLQSAMNLCISQDGPGYNFLNRPRPKHAPKN